jgi:hypothetical protein
MMIKLLEALLRTAILAFAWYVVEQISSREELEHLLAIQERFFDSIAEFEPWNLVRSFSTAFEQQRSLREQSGGPPIFLPDVLLAVRLSFRAIFKDTYPPAALAMLAIFLTLVGFSIRLLLRRPIIDFGSIILAVLLCLLLTAASTAAIHLVVLGGVVVFGWFLKTAMFFALTLSVVYFLLMRHLEHGIVEFLIHGVKRLLHPSSGPDHGDAAPARIAPPDGEPENPPQPEPPRNGKRFRRRRRRKHFRR